MLSISKPLIGDGAGLYYVELGREDYYLEGGEPPGKWVGTGAEVLGLEGQVRQEQFMVLFRGGDPFTLEKLTKNAGEEGRRAGWDLTFSAPKSVSALWAVADEDTRHKIQELHQRNIEVALSYIEEGAVTRRGKGGEQREKARAIFATFEHGTSRAQEPQLHTHAVLLNVGIAEDGTTGTLETADIFRRKMAAGAIYRAGFAADLEKELGVRAVRDRDSFAIEGVPEELTNHWSTRRKEIEEALKEKGFTGAKASAVAALDTRETKEDLKPRAELQQEWRREAIEHGFTPEKVQEMLGHEQKRNKEAEFESAIDKSLESLTRENSTFTERELITALAVESQGRGVMGHEALEKAREVLTEDDRIVLIAEGRERVFSTKEMVELERELVARAENLDTTARKELSERTVSEAISSRTLTEEQKKAVLHLTDSKHGVALATGLPGTGKSYTLSAVRGAYEKEGYEVLGTALAGKAARGLEEGAGVKSETIHKTLHEIESGKRALSSKTVLIVDEAAMVPTRLMHRVMEKAERANVKVILVGDSEQLQSIEAGGSFKGLEKRFGSAELTEIQRQRDDWAREAVKSFHKGDAEKGLRAFQERGLLTIAEDRNGAQRELIAAWRAEGVSAPKDNLILATTRAEVRSLNKAAQDVRAINAKIGSRSVTVEGEKIFEGDRVVINKNSRLLGVRNGDLGTVKDINGKSIRIELDNGKSARINVDTFKEVTLGYAVTTHKAQGATAENVFVLGGGPMTDKHMAVVQVSRARGETKVFIEKAEAGGLTQIAREMSRSQKKELAIDKLPVREPSQSRDKETNQPSPSKSVDGPTIRITPPKRRLGF